MKPYNPSVDYCGPGKSWVTKFISNTPWGANINRCCYAHDVAYELGGTGQDRERADVAFRECIEDQFVKRRWTPNFLGKIVAKRYYIFVRRFGSSSWTYKDAPGRCWSCGADKTGGP